MKPGSVPPPGAPAATSAPPPDVAVARVLASRFGNREPALRAYADRLAVAGVQRGLIGPGEVPRLWERHLLNCAVLADLPPPEATVCDLGSGAGLPGIVLALARPDLQVVLLEPLLRRVRFLEETVADLGLRSVRVRRGRAQDVVGTLCVDVVTARAVAPLTRLVSWALPLLTPGGELLALKGDNAAAELAAAPEILRSCGAASWRVERRGTGLAASDTTVVRVRAGANPPAAASDEVTGRIP